MPRLREGVIPATAGLAAASAAAAFAALARVLALWTGDFGLGAGLAAACAAAGLGASLPGRAPEPERAWRWRLAAGAAGAAFAAWLRLVGLNSSDPALLAPSAPVPALALLPAAGVLFLLLGRAARTCAPARPRDLAAAPAALLLARAALDRVEAPLLLALAAGLWLLAVPPRAALAGLSLAAVLALPARAALRDTWTARLDALYPGWTWLLPAGGREGLGAVRFPDGRLALLRAGRLYFDDHPSARAALLAVLAQREAGAATALLVRPRSPALAVAARQAGLEATVVDPDPRAAALLEALWAPTAPGAPLDPAWAPRRRPDDAKRYGLLMLRVPGRGAAGDRRDLADRRALAAWRERLEPGAPAGIRLAGQAAEADVAALKEDAAAAFGHAAVLDLPASVVVIASPAPVLTDAGELAARLPLSARMGWDAAAFLGALPWRPDGPAK